MTDDIDEIMMLLNSMPSGVEKENENSVTEKVAIQSVPVEPKPHKSSANDLDDLIASIATLNQEAKGSNAIYLFMSYSNLSYFSIAEY